MTRLIYSHITDIPCSQVEDPAAWLPENLLKRIEVKKGAQRICSIVGYYLLLQLFKKMYYNAEELLREIQYNGAGKPFLVKGPAFSISYSNELVVALAGEGELGIDVEKINDPDLSLYESYFSVKEWSVIYSTHQPLERFYQLWTRKEAVVKANGAGLSDDLACLNVLTETVSFNGRCYQLQDISMPASYSCSVASSIHLPAISPEHFYR